MEITRPESKQPLPSHAKRVWKGGLFEVYEWEQELFDGSFETFEKLKRRDTVSVIPVTKEGTIIINLEEQPGHSAPFFTNPAGQLEEGEQVLAGAARELLEETGYTAESWELWHSLQPVTKIDWAVYILIAKGCVKAQEATPDIGEKIELREVTFEQFCSMVATGVIAHDNMRIAVLEAMVYPEKMIELRKLFGF
ncbi:MAG: NUDIX hydrolase [Patescibacteria group bacterium]